MPTRIPLIGAGICVLGLDSRFCVDLAAKKRFVRCANVPPLGTIKPRLRWGTRFYRWFRCGPLPGQYSKQAQLNHLR
jgi:hypothetical protein